MPDEIVNVLPNVSANPALLLSLLLVMAFTLLLLLWLQRRALQKALDGILQREEARRQADTEALIGRMRESFGSIALDVQARSNESFLQLARETLGRHTHAAQTDLEGKRQLIEQSLEAMRTDLRKVEELVVSFERDRGQKYGELSEQLRKTAEFTQKLQETTHKLHEALSSSRARGQWGERMAEDILRRVGFLEGVNYQKQKTLEGEAGRPDFTFFLPKGLRLHMDVKFPFDNYLRQLEAGEEAERARFIDRFLKDVRARFREITTKEYINPADNTLDYALLFIPNEQVYAFIQEQDSTLLEEALKNRVVLCSPLTLYAILVVIRQSVDNFTLEKKASEILSLLGAFQKQWDLFIRSLEKMGKRIEDAQKEFELLMTTRRNQLERALRAIEEIRKEKGLDPVELPGEPEGLPVPDESVSPGQAPEDLSGT